MKTSEIKVTAKETLKEIDVHVKANERLSDIVNSYVEWAEKNVPKEFFHQFGIGIAGSHSQFGDIIGFYSGEYYRVTGSGYYIANDFSAWVNGSDFHQMLIFAGKIPTFIKNGTASLSNSNKEALTLVDKLESIDL